MAHEIETAMFVKEPAWHKLGVVLDHPPTSDEAIKAAGLDWDVLKLPLVGAVPRNWSAGDPGLVDAVQIPNQYCVVRNNKIFTPEDPDFDCDTQYDTLGIVSDRYQITQNREAFGFMDNVLGKGIEYEAAGSLKGGKVVWILANMLDKLDIGGGDLVNQYLLFSHSHDGTKPIQITMTPTRVVCWNTLTLALKDARTTFKVRHTRSAKLRLTQAEDVLVMSTQIFGEMGQRFEAMANIALTAKRAREITEFLLIKGLKVDEVMEESSVTEEKEDIATRTQNRITLVQNLWAGQAIGSEYVTMKQSVWGWLNSVTEAVDHHWSDTVRGVKDDDSAKLGAMWFGQGSRMKAKAMEMALAEVAGRGKTSVLAG